MEKGKVDLPVSSPIYLLEECCIRKRSLNLTPIDLAKFRLIELHVHVFRMRLISEFCPALTWRMAPVHFDWQAYVKRTAVYFDSLVECCFTSFVKIPITREGQIVGI